MIAENDMLFKFLLKCKRNAHKPDLHSFRIDIIGGIAIVECFTEEAKITEFVGDKKTHFVGTYIAVANRLDKLGADYNTIDM